MTERREPSEQPHLLFGMPVDPLSMEQVVARCRRALVGRTRMMIVVVNAAKMTALRTDADLRDSLLDCDMVIADGQSVVWASRLLRRRLPERVTGIDLFERLLDEANRDGWSVYLLGATPEIIETLQDRLRERWPDLKVAGARDGYFTDAEAADVAADIRAAHADMLFLGMTSPKKEVFLGTYGPVLDVPVLHGVGGSFDVLAGKTKRAPRLWQRAGMEWAYRLLQEPRRMWRRYLRTNTAFLAHLAVELVRPAPPYRRSRPLPAAASVTALNSILNTVIDLRDQAPVHRQSSGA
jgi:N-acetylglucosaminyldiphosphoundecaprenol N-acetyl-beta-D-mannosaminyltransferase